MATERIGTQIALSEPDRIRLSTYIEKELGIKMPARKKSLLEGRLSKRLRFLKMSSFSEYIDFLMSAAGFENEISTFVDIVSTHKTDFFREPEHFTLLRESVLPEIADNLPSNGVCRIWCAGCSSGEEAYTIAMVLAEFARGRVSRFPYAVHATDISDCTLDKALTGIYTEEQVIPIPSEMRKRYVLRSKDSSSRKVRVSPEIRKTVRFRRLNFMDANYDMKHVFDAAFYRNVAIYFDRDNQERVLRKIISNIRVGGYLFIGHSESIEPERYGLTKIAGSTFRKHA